MSLRWFEGFEARQNSTALAQAYSGLTFGSASIVAGRLHGSALQNQGATATVLTTPVFTAGDVWIVGLAFKRGDNSTTNRKILDIQDGANRQITLSSFGSGGVMKLQVYTDSPGGASSWTASSDFAFDTWYYVELKVTVAPSTSGSFELRVNGGTALSQTGVNTSNSGTSQADRIAINCIGTVTDATLLDDIYVCDDAGTIRNDFLGDVTTEGLLPDSDGFWSEWAPKSGGSHFSEVDDDLGPDGDGSYVSTATTSVKDSYGFPDLTFINGNILGLLGAFNARILTSGSRTLRPFVRHGGTDYNGASKIVGATSYTEQNHIWEQNPGTAADWTVSDINGVEFGVEAVA